MKSRIITTLVALGMGCLVTTLPPRSPQSGEELGGERGPQSGPSYGFFRSDHGATGMYSGMRELEFSQTIPDFDSQKLKEWTAVGPLNAGGRVLALAVDYRDSDILISGGASGGIFRSVDGGENWLPVSSSEHVRVSSLAQDTLNMKGDTWYATTGELAGARSFHILGHGIYKSSDNGVSWDRLSSTAGGGSIQLDDPFTITHRVQLHPRTGDVYVAALRGIYRSSDGGNVFARVLGDDFSSESERVTEENGYTDVHIASKSSIYAALRPYPGSEQTGSIFRSSAGGLGEWTDITPSFFVENVNNIVISSSPSAPNVVYFAMSFVDFNLSISLGRDVYLHRYDYDEESGSGSWQDLSVNIPNEKTDPFAGSFTYKGYCLGLSLHPENSSEVFLGMIGIHRSTDGFTTPYPRTSERPFGSFNSIIHADIQGFAFDPSDTDKMYIFSDGGINKTLQSQFPPSDPPDDPDELRRYFTLNNNGLNVAQVFDISLAGPEVIIAGTQDQGSWAGREGQPDWIQYGGGDVYKVNSSRDGRFTLLYSTNAISPVSLIRNVDFRFLTANENSTQSRSFTSRHFLFDPSGRYRIFAIESRGLVVIDDADAFEADPDSNPPRVTEVPTVPLGEPQLYLNGPVEVTTYPEPVLLTFTYGESEEFSVSGHQSSPDLVLVTGLDSDHPVFRRVSSEQFPKADANDIFANPHDGRRILVSFRIYDSANKIVFSSDGGSTWENVTGNLASQGPGNPGPLVLSVAEVGYDGIFLAGTTSGLFATRNLEGNSTVWQRESSDQVKNHLVTDIEVDEVTRVTIGTFGGGVYRAVYDSAPLPPVRFLCPFEPVDLVTGTSRSIQLDRYVGGDVGSIDAVSSHPSLVEVALAGRVLTLNARAATGLATVTVTLHADAGAIGSIQSFAVRVHDAGTAQASLTYRIDERDVSYLSGKVIVNNTGALDFSILAFSRTRSLRLTFNTLPVLVPSGSSRELTFYYYPGPLDRQVTRMVFRISEHPFVLDLELDLQDTALDSVTAGQAEGPPDPPRVRGMPADRQVFLGGAPLVLEVSRYLRAAQGRGSLDIVATAMTVGVASLEVDGSCVLISPVALGQTLVQISGTQAGSDPAALTFRLTVVPAANRPPEVTGTLPPLTLLTNDEPLRINLAGLFSDDSGSSSLVFRAGGVAAGIVDIRVDGSFIHLSPGGVGQTRVDVHATDSEGSSTTVPLSFTVQVIRAPVNLAPILVSPIPDQQVEEGLVIDLDASPHFTDDHANTDLSGMAVSGSPGIVRVSVSGLRMTVEGLAAGESRVVFTVTDPLGESVSASFQVRVLLPPQPPEISLIEVVSAPRGSVYAIGETIEIKLTFTLPVAVQGGVPGLLSDLDSGSVLFTWHGPASFLPTLLFSYEIRTGDFDGDGTFAFGEDALRLRGAIISDERDRRVVALGSALATAASPGQVVDGVPPSLTSLEMVSRPSNSWSYNESELIEVRANFSEAVEVRGTPELVIDIASGPARAALRSTAAGALHLDFGYTVQSGDRDEDGLSLLALEPGDTGSIHDVAGNEALLDFPEDMVLNLPGHRVGPFSPPPPESVLDAEGRDTRNPQEFRVCPNPVVSSLHFSIPGDQHSVSAALYDLSGTLLDRRFFAADTTPHEFGIESLPAGTYVLVVEGLRHFWVRTILIRPFSD